MRRFRRSGCKYLEAHTLPLLLGYLVLWLGSVILKSRRVAKSCDVLVYRAWYAGSQRLFWAIQAGELRARAVGYRVNSYRYCI